ncbi:MAG: hypothetical protein L0H31_17140 [Nocardioidaceae bacterium]|nr:hypothetical protein [Nocardioidaceae bacterium]
MAEHQYIDHVAGHVLASARPVSIGWNADLTVHNDVQASAAEPELFERDEVHLEDVVLEIRQTNAPIVVGLGAVAYLHPGATVARVTIGGSVYLCEGATVEDADEVALARGEITIARWHIPESKRKAS